MTDTVYDFTVPGKKKTEKNLADYKGKVLLIVNTASMKLYKNEIMAFVECCRNALPLEEK